ncbi:MAG: hypothetical protein J1F39_01375 [Clostridiales bacterium]|nr:hypothetical protein [Clostridiales bacterium]
MTNKNNVDNNPCERNGDCKISAADVARAEVFPKHTHLRHSADSECGEDCGCLNSHLRKEDCECGCDDKSGNCECANESNRDEDCECGKDWESAADSKTGYSASASPSVPADPACRGNSLLECGVDVFAGNETYGTVRSRPTNPNYKMIDPDDDSADAGKS